MFTRVATLEKRPEAPADETCLRELRARMKLQPGFRTACVTRALRHAASTLMLSVVVACTSAPASRPHPPRAYVPTSSVSSTAQAPAASSLASAASATNAPKYEAELAVVVVLDSSGSMTGLKLEWAKAVAKAVLAALGDDELFETLLAMTPTGTLVTMRRPIDRAAIRKQIATVVAGGMARLADGIRAAADDLAGFVVRHRHIVFVTDASDQGQGIYTASLYARDKGDTMTLVVVGGESTAPFAGLLQPKSLTIRTFDAANANDIPTALADELARVRAMK